MFKLDLEKAEEPEIKLPTSGKESAFNAGDLGSISGLGRSPGEGKGYSLQYSGASLVAQLVKNLICLQCRRPGFDPWVGKIPWVREKGNPLQYKESACNAGDPGSIPGLGRPLN